MNNSTNPLTVSGNVANGGYLLTLGGIGSIAMSSSLTGSGGLQQNGSGTTTISATAGLTYTGGTTVNAGKLSFYGGTNGGTPVTTTFAINGGDLDFLNGAYMGSCRERHFRAGRRHPEPRRRRHDPVRRNADDLDLGRGSTIADHRRYQHIV